MRRLTRPAVSTGAEPGRQAKRWPGSQPGREEIIETLECLQTPKKADFEPIFGDIPGLISLEIYQLVSLSEWGSGGRRQS